MHAASCMDLARRRERPRRDPKLLDFRHELRGWEWSGIRHRGSPLRHCTKIRGIRGEEVGFRRGVPVPTPARPGSGSKGCRASGGLSAPCRGTPWMRRLSAECGPAVKAPSAGPHFGKTVVFEPVRHPDGGDPGFLFGSAPARLSPSPPGEHALLARLGYSDTDIEKINASWPTPHACFCRESTALTFTPR